MITLKPELVVMISLIADRIYLATIWPVKALMPTSVFQRALRRLALISPSVN
jgi:hypothetical protein